MTPRHSPRCNAEHYAGVLCTLYETYHKREFVHPDPLEFLYDYPDVRDREIAALVAACLAYGNVHQILKSVSKVLKRIGQHPYAFVATASVSSIDRTIGDFQYRFTTRDELIMLFKGIKGVVERYGSLGKCFVTGLHPEHGTTLPALSHFVKELARSGGGRPSTLLPLPERGSACKRLNLFLRWMARRDRVDPGGWDDVPPSKLVIPVDVHIMRICSKLGLTQRKQADAATAMEITAAFRAIEPDDPVKYDFVLSRLGIRDDLSPEGFLRSCAKALPAAQDNT
ncbi:MAG: TIGR02757 family protein [Desulfomonilaceae bacterium]